MNTLKNDILRLIRKHRPTQTEFTNALREARRDARAREILGRVKKRKAVKLPYVPTEEELKKFLKVLENEGKLKYRLMVKMLMYTGLRSFEMTGIRREDVQIGSDRIIIRQGKGSKDRIVPIFKPFRNELLLYMDTIPRNVFLFENRNGEKYSERYIRKIFQEYRKKSGVGPIRPHSMRHFLLTWLTRQGWRDAEIMLISGHSQKESLKIYQHLALPDVEDKFNDALKEIDV